MKTVTIFNNQYQVNEQAYKALLSVNGKNECISMILVLGLQTGSIILHG
jgi:dihydrodipicolinate synthase/N-acetylneuraminate lyase